MFICFMRIRFSKWNSNAVSKAELVDQRIKPGKFFFKLWGLVKYEFNKTIIFVQIKPHKNREDTHEPNRWCFKDTIKHK